jgi:hypothetical protein
MLAGNDPLEAVKLKVKRAYSSIVEINDKIQAFVPTISPVPTFLTEVNAAGTEETLKVKLSPITIPAEIAVIAGESLYNLRSALDHLACRLAEINGSTDISKTAFPFGKTKEVFDRPQVQEKIAQLSDEARVLISNLKPYKGGNDLLWAIHELNKTDKHRTLVAIVMATTAISGNIGLTAQNDGLFFLQAPPPWSRIDQDIPVLVYTPGLKPDANLKLSFSIAFGDIKGIEREPIVKILHQFCDLTQRIVGDIEGQFFRNAEPIIVSDQISATR